MVFSKLITRREVSLLSGQSRQGQSVERLIVHHIASTALESSVRFMKSWNERKSCPTYVIGNGQLIGMIGEEFRPCSTGAADLNSIAVEILNESTGGAWPVEESSLELLAELLADLSVRYNWGSIEIGKNLVVHRDFMATECPGPYVVERLREVCDKANEILKIGGSTTMVYKYEYINGQRVEVHVAAAFKKLAEAFKKETGCELLVTSGTRTRAEQQALYDGWIAKKPGFNLAAPPGRSNHEESGPVGPRALDLRDSGKDAGVTVIGTKRSNILVRLAKKFGFTPAGHSFSPREGWHYEFTGKIGGSAPASSESASEKVKARQRAINSWTGLKVLVDGIVGPKTVEGYRKLQKMIGVPVDGIWGSETQAAYTAFYKARGSKLAVDGSFGSGTVSKLQSFLGVRVDGQWGPASKKALQRALGVTADGIVGPGTIRALQKRVGAGVDGIWGSGTTRKLQERLNQGRF